ncbi:hypothetical protein [Roseibium sp.]|uniref:hypothetical protein n=1 Tax=Roseibium sp. TaxID=1936156 RepID=UPI003A987997
MFRCPAAVQIAIYVCVVSLHSTAAEATRGSLSCDFSRETSPLVTAQITNLDIEGAELKFPRDYIFSQPFESGTERDALLLRADVKDFSSYPKAKSYFPDGRSKISAGIRDSMRILITSHLPMSAVLNNIIASKHKIFDYIQSGQIKVESKDTIHNLLVTSGYTADGWMKDDVFFQLDGDVVTDVIACSVEGQVPNPGCWHIFEAGAYDVKISYNRSELPRWRELRDGAAELLQCFTIKEPFQLP